MKKFIYSNITKTVTAILFIVFVTFGVLNAVKGFLTLYNEEEMIYNFENDFNDTDHFFSILHSPESTVFTVIHGLYNELDEDMRQEIQNGTATIDPDLVEVKFREQLGCLYSKNEIDYFVEFNGTIFTNCGATHETELMNDPFFYHVSRDSEGFVTRSSSHSLPYNYRPSIEEISPYDKTSNITIVTSVKEDYVAKCKDVWERQASIINDTAERFLAYSILALLLLIYLLCVCGKKEDGEQKSIWIDNVWLEVHLIAVVGFVSATAAVCVFLFQEKFFLQPFLNLIIGTATAITSAIFITTMLSIVRNIKCKKFIETSIIVRALKLFFKTAFSVLKWLRNGFIKYRNLIFAVLSRKLGAIYVISFLAYTALIGLIALCITSKPGWLFVFALVAIAALFVVAYRAKDLEDIKKGVEEIRKGNLNYKIPEPKSSDMQKLAENVNDIAKGLDESVSAKVKAERMKTELITNVSHDLKTPLTSIINYTELLSKMEGLPEEACDYIKVIAAKSDRLKTLTQDLFDISKVQSGNDEAVIEKIDLSLLINQSLGEYDGEIKNSLLTFCVDVPKEIHILADGKKMSRVISNLINNILKYSMSNTRAFISAYEKNDEVTIEFKNIASYPMNFSADEIVGRFVRGDESRTAEGNGLGLAIAKSYTEICNGRFDVVIDGDMFKTILKFKKYN